MGCGSSRSLPVTPEDGTSLKSHKNMSEGDLPSRDNVMSQSHEVNSLGNGGGGGGGRKGILKSTTQRSPEEGEFDDDSRSGGNEGDLAQNNEESPEEESGNLAIKTLMERCLG